MGLRGRPSLSLSATDICFVSTYNCLLYGYRYRYSVLPGIGVRSESEQSIHEAADSERLPLGSLLLPRDDEPILEECLDAPDAARPGIPAQEYGMSPECHDIMSIYVYTRLYLTVNPI